MASLRTYTHYGLIGKDNTSVDTKSAPLPKSRDKQIQNNAMKPGLTKSHGGAYPRSTVSLGSAADITGNLRTTAHQ
jgi:hypothetical protein